MGINRTYRAALLGFVLLPIQAVAQTVNIGELTIEPNTQFSTLFYLDNKSSALLVNNGEVFIYNHLNNDGHIDFTDGEGGITRFEGMEAQQLSGSNVCYFNNVLFSNESSTTGTFELSGAISIANEAIFNRGIVQNDGFGGSIIFEDNAAQIGTSDRSHVDGFVMKKGDDDFIYPIGDAQFFRRAIISTTDNGDDVFNAKYFFENPVGTTIDSETPTHNTASSVVDLDTAEFWTLTRDSGSGSVLLTLSWEEASTTPLYLVEDPETLHIVRWDQLQQTWVDEGGIVDITNKTVTTPLTLKNYGIFTLGRVADDIDLEVFNVVTPNGDNVHDYFLINSIQNLANNNVQIFNRWGVKVFETDDYDTTGNVFDGFSQGRTTINPREKLPSGTYFYIISYDYKVNGVKNDRLKKTGHLYIS